MLPHTRVTRKWSSRRFSDPAPCHEGPKVLPRQRRSKGAIVHQVSTRATLTVHLLSVLLKPEQTIEPGAARGRTSDCSGGALFGRHHGDVLALTDAG